MCQGQNHPRHDDQLRGQDARWSPARRDRGVCPAEEADSILWTGQLADKVFLGLDLRVVLFTDSSLRTTGRRPFTLCRSTCLPLRRFSPILPRAPSNSSQGQELEKARSCLRAFFLLLDRLSFRRLFASQAFLHPRQDAVLVVVPKVNECRQPWNEEECDHQQRKVFVTPSMLPNALPRP